MPNARFPSQEVPQRPASENLLLKALPTSILHDLRPHLEQVSIERDMLLTTAGVPVEHVYFIDSGLVALRSGSIDVGALGCEGTTGVCLTTGADRSPYDHAVQIAGTARRLDAETYKTFIDGTPAFRQTMLLYAQALMVQMAEHIVCNANQSLQVRVARWLLMCHDRIRRSDIDITHACLAAALSVRRAGVTDALHILEGLHAIRSRRGSIAIRDRSRLEEAAREAYGVAEAEYERLLSGRGASLSPAGRTTIDAHLNATAA